ncbi:MULTISPECIES: peptidylprolyl isomerase [Thermodesulfovibrio]|uniref:peptidylprolyl isomerase n=1 Tax=Thermodesulfovibrio yellowstonii (strain ATCC 51303 / DSM 11347 / YP87) TaxID=289376 RepID=B5YLC4_THEYD|nr:MULTISPECIES: peptidyl-prolyl cis-trans isomerase [Thermodesulfovibrio]ACI20865.1 foldase protein PrsA 1, putative [Thermodesulfovibrio yellowstonii DSM 11347]
MKYLKIFVIFTIFSLFFACSKSDEVVVKAGSSKLTKKELQEDIKSLPPQTKAFLASPEGVNRLKDELIKREVLYEEAKKKNLAKSEEFKRRMEEFKKITLINMLLEQEIKTLQQVTEQDAKEYYEKNKDMFIKPVEVRLSQIVVKNEDEAKKVYERIDKGEEFSKIAKELSRDEKTKASGGDIGFFKKGQLNPQIENVAFSLRKGQVSMPLTFKGELYIFKITDVKGNPIDFEQIKGQLIEQLKAKKQQDWFNTYIDDLKKKHKVEINEKALQEILNQSLIGGKSIQPQQNK